MTVSANTLTRKSPGLALLLLAGLLPTVSLSLAADAGAPQPQVLKPAEVEFFESKIRPLLVRRCYACHSAEPAPMGELRLDTREGWVSGGSRGPAIVPGNPSRSLLIQAVNYKDPKLSMPPEGTLPLEEIELLEQWVAVGAPDPRSDASGAAPVQDSIDLEEGRKFWSFRPLAQPALPAVRDRDWVRSPLDRFVLARLEEKGLKTAGPADRRTWLRRVTLDLIGLPPSPEDVEAFLGDSSPQAYETAVDRLLASPHYGERWARYWLDLARYAEEQRANNHSRKELPYAYKYRDWVVEAFNRDLGYDRFIMQQIAGDLMNGVGMEGWSALGFLSLGPIYESDGGGKESKLRHRYDTMDDKIDTLSRAVLGLTVSCAPLPRPQVRSHPHRGLLLPGGRFLQHRVCAPQVDGALQGVRSLRVPASGAQGQGEMRRSGQDQKDLLPGRRSRRHEGATEGRRRFDGQAGILQGDAAP